MDGHPLRIAVVGAGAIGGWLAARLALAGHDVSILARPGRSPAYADGVRLEDGGRSATVAIPASDVATALGEQDLVILAPKAFALAGAAEAAAPLIGPHSLLLPLVNGVPFWFADGLASVDPDGRIAAALPAERVIGGVVHASVRREGPAHIVVQKVDHLIVGEPAGGHSARAADLAGLFADAGIPARADPAIRRAIWYKAWGNMTMNPLSALTLATADRILAECRPQILAAMEEARTIGDAIGCPIEEAGEARVAVTEALGAFKTSMLQDVEAGRPIELDALLGAPIELARRHGIATPVLDALYSETRLLAESRGLLP